ncbi:MAG: ABC transporter permease [Bacteroides sp.]|nr:ABC transporter permease [Bacteroides sp.]
MNIKFLKQAWKLFGQNRLFSLLSLGGTALTLALVMTVYMMYYLRTADIDPEPNRSRLFHSGPGYSQLEDNSDRNIGMSRRTAGFLYGELPELERVSYYTEVHKVTCSDLSGMHEARYSLRGCDPEWFDIFSYTFLSGRPISREEWDAGRHVVVLSATVAMDIFQTTDVVGEEVLVDFHPTRVIGVVKPVSHLFVTAYADVWVPVTAFYPDAQQDRTGGLRGSYRAALVRKAGVSEQEVRTAVERKVEQLNAELPDYTFSLHHFRTHEQHLFPQESRMTPSLVFVLLMAVLLIVPAINISGMVQSHIRSRMEEIGIRKAYGAPAASIYRQLLAENMLLTLFGGIIGYLISCLIVVKGGHWMFGSASLRAEAGLMNVGLFFNADLFLMVLLLCVLFNVLSVMVPVWMAIRRPITEIIQGE